MWRVPAHPMLHRHLKQILMAALCAGAVFSFALYAWQYALPRARMQQLARCWRADEAAAAPGLQPPPPWEDAALRRFIGTNYDAAGEPLLYTAVTLGFADMAAGWACRARDAAQQPHAIALDGHETCAALAALVPWLPCHALSNTSATAFEAFGTHAYHALMALRSELAYRLLALGRDLLQCDADAVFAPNASLRMRDFIDARADVQTLERASLGTLGRVTRTLTAAGLLVWPNFGLVYVRASPRTTALLRLLWHEQLARGYDDQIVYTHCANTPLNGLRHAHFDRRRFIDGLWWHGGKAVPEWELGHPINDGAAMRRWPAVAPVLAHLTWAPSAPKLRLLGYWGLWRAECGNTTLPALVDAPRPGGPRLFPA